MKMKTNQVGNVFNDYLFNERIRSRSPIRNNENGVNNNKQKSFAELSRPASRSGSTKKGLFGISIEKIKLKQELKVKENNPYFLLGGSGQPTKTKSPCKLLSLKSHGSLNRPKSPLRYPNNIIVSKHQQLSKPITKNQNITVRFSNLTKKSIPTINPISNSNNNKQNNSNIPNIQNKQISNSKQKEFSPSLQNSLNKLLIKDLNNQQSPHPLINTSISSVQDQVNISINQSIMKLDMNPF